MNLLLVIPAVLATTGVIGGHFLEPPASPPPGHLAIGVGRFDAIDNDEQQPATDLRLEYRFAHSLYSHGAVRVLPFVGLEATSDRAAFGLAGLIAEVCYGPLTLSPGLAVGAYDDGDGRKLGATTEFRSQFELGYAFAGGHRVAAALSHISNADLGDENPGVEVISLYYFYPLR